MHDRKERRRTTGFLNAHVDADDKPVDSATIVVQPSLFPLKEQ